MGKKMRRKIKKLGVEIKFSTVGELNSLLSMVPGSGTQAFGKVWRIKEALTELFGYWKHPNGQEFWGLDLDNPKIEDDEVVGYRRAMDEGGKKPLDTCILSLPKSVISAVWSKVCEPILEGKRNFLHEQAIRNVCEAFIDHGLLDLWKTTVIDTDDSDGNDIPLKEFFQYTQKELAELVECNEMDIHEDFIKGDLDLLQMAILSHAEGFNMKQEDVTKAMKEHAEKPEPEVTKDKDNAKAIRPA